MLTPEYPVAAKHPITLEHRSGGVARPEAGARLVFILSEDMALYTGLLGEKYLPGRALGVLAGTDADAAWMVGDDGFALLLTADDCATIEVAKKAVSAFRSQIMLPDGSGPVVLNATAGIASCDSADGPAGALGRARVAARWAAATGRDWQIFNDSLAHSTAKRLRMESLLSGALGRGEMSVAYQPIFSTGVGRVDAVEALARWNGGALGPVAPLEFIPLAERTGVIVPLGAWILRQACADVAALRAQGFGIDVAVNVSPRQLAEHDFGAMVLAELKDSGLPADRLVLEVTESAMLEPDGTGARQLCELAGHGVRLSVDDFGTGYSSFGRVRQLPFSSLKIDKVFTDELAVTGGNTSVLQAAISMAHGLGLAAVAEGVETPGQLDALAGMGCDQVQGFLMARPMARPALTDHLAGLAASHPV